MDFAVVDRSTIDSEGIEGPAIILEQTTTTYLDAGYSVARVQLSNAGDGNHEITGSAPFGISVYGYGDDTSYWYPGGLDLEHIN